MFSAVRFHAAISIFQCLISPSSGESRLSSASTFFWCSRIISRKPSSLARSCLFFPMLPSRWSYSNGPYSGCQFRGYWDDGMRPIYSTRPAC